jgi:histone H3/H4
LPLILPLDENELEEVVQEDNKEEVEDAEDSEHDFYGGEEEEEEEQEESSSMSLGDEYDEASSDYEEYLTLEAMVMDAKQELEEFAGAAFPQYDGELKECLALDEDVCSNGFQLFSNFDSAQDMIAALRNLLQKIEIDLNELEDKRQASRRLLTSLDDAIREYTSGNAQDQVLLDLAKSLHQSCTAALHAGSMSEVQIRDVESIVRRLCKAVYARDRVEPAKSAWIREVRNLRSSTDLVIDEDAFDNLVFELGQDFKTDLFWEPSALEAIQYAAESFLVDMFEEMVLIQLATPADEDLKRRKFFLKKLYSLTKI